MTYDKINKETIDILINESKEIKKIIENHSFLEEKYKFFSENKQLVYEKELSKSLTQISKCEDKINKYNRMMKKT